MIASSSQALFLRYLLRLQGVGWGVSRLMPPKVLSQQAHWSRPLHRLHPVPIIQMVMQSHRFRRTSIPLTLISSYRY